MDLKLVSVIVFLCASAITYSEASIPKCCMKIDRRIPISALKFVERSYMQQSSGPCDITALVLYITNREIPICAPPSLKLYLDRFRRRLG